MDQPKDPRRVKLEQDMPTELIEPIIRLYKRRERLNFRMLPRDAFAICALLQFADRNPGLEPDHHAVLQDFGNQLIAAIANIEPILEPYMLLGWNPDHDVPISDKEKKHG
jgi:hypothetical protein